MELRQKNDPLDETKNAAVYFTEYDVQQHTKGSRRNLCAWGQGQKSELGAGERGVLALKPDMICTEAHCRDSGKFPEIVKVLMMQIRSYSCPSLIVTFQK